MTDPFFVLVAVLAVLVVAIGKSGLAGGLGIAGVPLLSMIMPAREAAGMLLPVLLVMDAVALVAYRHEFDRKILKVMLPGALAGVALGWALSSIISEDAVRLVVGLITLAFIIDTVLPLRRAVRGDHTSKSWGRFWGSVAGFTSFVSHTGGPPYQIHVLPQRLAPALYAGTAAWFFAAVNAAKLGPYVFLGQLNPANLGISALLIPVGIAGMLFGVYLVRRIPAKLFYRIAYGLVFVLALKLVYDGARGTFGI